MIQILKMTMFFLSITAFLSSPVFAQTLRPTPEQISTWPTSVITAYLAQQGEFFLRWSTSQRPLNEAVIFGPSTLGPKRIASGIHQNYETAAQLALLQFFNYQDNPPILQPSIYPEINDLLGWTHLNVRTYIEKLGGYKLKWGVIQSGSIEAIIYKTNVLHVEIFRVSATAANYNLAANQALIQLITLHKEESTVEPPHPQSEGTVLNTVLNFENEPLGFFRTPSIWYYRWPFPKASATDYSTLTVEKNLENKYLKMWISDLLPDAVTSFKSPMSRANLNSVVPVFTLAPYLFPEVDTLRVKIKMEQGQVGLSFGSPVSQVGNSDVLTAVKNLSVTDMSDCIPTKDGWHECDFDFNEKLIRNNRRGNFSLDQNKKTIAYSTGELQGQEIIHYTRWVQEPIYLYVVSYDSTGKSILSGNPTFLLDDFQFIHKGKGKKFPNFTSTETKKVVDDFETSISNAFTVNFDFPTPQPAPVLSHVPGGLSGNQSLQIVSNTREENAWTGINAKAPEESNAVSFDLKLSYTAKTSDPNLVIDFIALASPASEPAFNWEGLSTLLTGYKYFISRKNTVDKDFAIYHARRILPRDQWLQVVIPFADFVAAYGSGVHFTAHHSELKPLLGDEISVIGIQSAYNNNKGATTIQIDQIKYLKVPGTELENRSYWQLKN